QIPEEHPLHEKDQHDAEDHIVQHGASGGVDQLLAVVDLLEPHPRRQDAGRVDLLDFRLDAADRRHALLAAAHQHDALDDVLVAVLPDDAETWLVPDDHRGNIFDIHR